MEPNTKSTDTTFTLDDVKPRGEPFQAMEFEFGLYNSFTEKIARFGQVPFVSGLYEAYGLHCPVKFSPDDFWFLIIQDFNNYVNFNAEKLRSKLVSHEGKKKLEAEIKGKSTIEELTGEDFKEAINQLVGKIPEFVKDMSLVEKLTPTFSTSTQDNLYVKKLNVMSTLKEYFDYRMNLYGCGFPSITLTGTVADWEKIVTNLDELIKIDPLLEDVRPIMKKILDTKKGNVDKDFWRTMLKKKPILTPQYCSAAYLGDENEDYISGWILKFFNYYDWEQQKVKEVSVKEIHRLPGQNIQIPFLLKDSFGKEYNMKFVGGIMGMKQDQKTREISTAFGWYVFEQSLDDMEVLNEEDLEEYEEVEEEEEEEEEEEKKK